MLNSSINSHHRKSANHLNALSSFLRQVNAQPISCTLCQAKNSSLTFQFLTLPEAAAPIPNFNNLNVEDRAFRLQHEDDKVELFAKKAFEGIYNDFTTVNQHAIKDDTTLKTRIELHLKEQVKPIARKIKNLIKSFESCGPVDLTENSQQLKQLEVSLETLKEYRDLGNNWQGNAIIALAKHKKHLNHIRANTCFEAQKKCIESSNISAEYKVKMVEIWQRLQDGVDKETNDVVSILNKFSGAPEYVKTINDFFIFLTKEYKLPQAFLND